MLLFTVLLVNYYRKAFTLRPGTVAYQLAALAMLLNFIGAALFNPCLLTSAAAVSFGFLFALAAMGDCRQGTPASATPRPALLKLLPTMESLVQN